MNIATSAVQTLLNMVAPARCMNCAKEGTWLCNTCSAHYGTFQQSCIMCGAEHSRGLTCVSCRDDTPIIGVLSAGSYASPGLRRGIGWLKFRSIKGVAAPLARLIIPHLTIIAPIPLLARHAVLIPIPLHARRQRQRGFNQSEVIANELSRFTEIPIVSALTKHKSTWAQAQLPKEYRTKNADNAYEISSDQIPTTKWLILVDDVATSGATLTSAARTLEPAIPPESSIWAITIARG